MTAHPSTAAKLSAAELDEIRSLVENRSAILLDSSRERFFSARVSEYLAEKKLASGDDLLRSIRGTSAQYEAFLERLLTQETSFFRYPAVFEALSKEILPDVRERKLWETTRKLRIWSSGCSTGEEPYSMAITVCEALKFSEAWEIEILATDISQRTLRHAERGVYRKRSLESVPPKPRRKLFCAVEAGLPDQAAPAPHGFLRANEFGRSRVRRQVRLHFLHECAHVLFRGTPAGDLAPLPRSARARRIFRIRPCGDALARSGRFRTGRAWRMPPVSKTIDRKTRRRLGGGHPVTVPNAESMEIFLQEASDNLQFLREYSGLLQEPHAPREEMEKLYIAAHTLSGTSASYGFPQFSEVAAKLAHVFHYAMNAALTSDMHGPLTEFVSDAISVLEFDLLRISSGGADGSEDLDVFRQRYSFAFPVLPAVEASDLSGAQMFGESAQGVESSYVVRETLADSLPQDGEVPDDVLEFFVPEAEEHLQAITECLLALEGNPNSDEVNRLFRSIHTVKGSAAQVGLHRLSFVSHRVEDLIGQLREGTLQPTPEIVDLCLESVDVLKKFLHRQWANDFEMSSAVDALLARIADLAPETLADAAGIAGEPEQAAQAVASVETELVTTAQQAPLNPLAQAKSVRISLDRLDRMMNAVGELVINRTRMLGRLSELSKLVEVLNFSKNRLSGKISDFQEKHEFNRFRAALVPGSHAPQMDTFRGAWPARRSIVSNETQGFSELEMDRYDDFNILSRSLAEISADVTEVLTQLEGFMGRVDSDIDEFTKLAHHLQDEITAARMVPIGNLYTRLSRTVRDAAKASSKPMELALEGAETELDNNIIPAHLRSARPPGAQCRGTCSIEDTETRRRIGKLRERPRLRARLPSWEPYFYRGRGRRSWYRLRTDSSIGGLFRGGFRGSRRRAG